MPDIIPVLDLTTQDILYGDRVTSYRWEVLSHSSVTGLDSLVGILDGVKDGSLTWTQNAAVKGSGKIEVTDLAEASPGMMKISDLSLESLRLRPVCLVAGLPEDPKGTFLVSSATEAWDAVGRVWVLSLLDRCTVPNEEDTEESFSVPAGSLIFQTIQDILADRGEAISIDESSTLATSSGMVWEVGTSWLKIINDLLDVAGYNALWMDGYGNYQMTPRVVPAQRSLMYEVLGIPRLLTDGEQSIYLPSWGREKDSFKIPNKVIAVQAANGSDTTALTGFWINDDPASPYSTVSRGRTITHTLPDVECPAGTDPEIEAFLEQRARNTLIQMSSVQAQVKIDLLPIPVRVSDVLTFQNSRASINARHVITRLQLQTRPLGLMSATLQEVISL